MRLTVTILGTPTPGEVADALRRLSLSFRNRAVAKRYGIMRGKKRIARITITKED